MKFCPVCKQNKNLSEFYQRKKHRTGEYYEKCASCMKERGRIYYHANHEKQLKLALLRKKKYKDERRVWLRELKDKPCSDCGKKYPPHIMDFDHREGELKISSISWMVLRNTSNFEKIKLEISKCDLVCANCHRQRTYDRIQKRKNAALAKMVKASA